MDTMPRCPQLPHPGRVATRCWPASLRSGPRGQAPMAAHLLAALLLAGAGPVWANFSEGHVEARAWAPRLAAADDFVEEHHEVLNLRPMQAQSGQHPRDRAGSTGALATLSFSRPATGDATYRSFAGAFGEYASAVYDKGARTRFVLEGELWIVLYGAPLFSGVLLGPTHDFRFQVVSSLTGQLVATSLGGGVARAGVDMQWDVGGNQRSGSVELRSGYWSAPTIQAQGLFADASDLNRRQWTGAELATMYGLQHRDSVLFSEARGQGASLASVDVLDLQASFHQVGVASNNYGYAAPVRMVIETWAELGTAEWAFAAADLRNTLHLGFTLLDDNGLPSALPLQFVPSPVPEPQRQALLLLGLVACAAAARRQRGQGPNPTRCRP